MMIALQLGPAWITGSKLLRQPAFAYVGSHGRPHGLDTTQALDDEILPVPCLTVHEETSP